MNKDEIQLAKLVVTEIKTLRNQNEIMAAKLHMFDSMMLLFTSAPAYSGMGMSPDIIYDLEKRIAKSEDDLKAAEYQSERK